MQTNNVTFVVLSPHQKTPVLGTASASISGLDEEHCFDVALNSVFGQLFQHHRGRQRRTGIGAIVKS